MDPDVTIFAQVAVIAVLLVGSLSAITVALVRALSGRPKLREVSNGPNLQLEQLQMSVDAIAVEVERIAEAQRFSAKLLADRPEPPAIGRSEYPREKTHT